MAIRRLSDISYDQLIARPRKLASSQSCCGFSPDCRQNILTALFCPWRIATSLSTDLRSEWETPYGDGSIYGWETDHLSSYMTENYTFPYPILFPNPWCTLIFMSPGKTQQRVISFRISRPARFFLTLLSWGGDAALETCDSCWGIIPLWSSHLFNLASVSQGSSFPMDDRFESLAIGGVGHPLEDWPLFSSWSSVWSTPERRDSASIQVKEGN